MKYFAEFLGTFWLVFGGCGSAIFAATLPELGIGYIGVSFAFGLTVLTTAYAFSHISGGHFNPAVSIGLWVGCRFKGKYLMPYIISQLRGAIVAAFSLYLILRGQYGFIGTGGFATDGFNDLSPNGYNLTSVILTAFFLIIIMGKTSRETSSNFAPIAIGLSLTSIHLISIPITNTSVNPARSTGVALFSETAEISQLWVFGIVSIIGAVIGFLIYRFIMSEKYIK